MSRQPDLPHQIIDADEPRANKTEIDLEAECTSLIARHQPMAKELRTILMVMGITNDLERIADHSVNIAEAVVEHINGTTLKPDDDVLKMFEETIRMVDGAIRSFINEDPALGETVCRVRQHGGRPGNAHPRGAERIAGQLAHRRAGEARAPEDRRKPGANRRPVHEHRRGRYLHDRGPGHQASPGRGRPVTAMSERVAAIDVGSNAIRFVAAESDAQSFRVVEETRVPVRLGHGVFSTGRIDDTAAAEAVAGIARAGARMKELGIDRYRAVATSAVRESQNRRAFVRRVHEASGLRLEVISGSEEMRLVHAAVRRRMLLGSDTWAMVELGGGSVEIGLADETRVSWSETHAMGAVRLMEMFTRGNSEPEEFSRLIQEYVATIRLPVKVAERGGAKGFIATGGNIESIARICRGSRGANGPLAVAVAEVRELVGRLSAHDR